MIGLWRNYATGRSPANSVFNSGQLPYPLPDGKYKGSASFNTGPWVGKSFNNSQMTGINNFEGENFRFYDSFSFKTYTGKGLKDKDLEVLKIDYDIPGNNWLVRRVLDEVVETEPGKYLGKAHLRLIPGLPFTLVYFRLEK
jgi:hypothetical protein